MSPSDLSSNNPTPQRSYSPFSLVSLLSTLRHEAPITLNIVSICISTQHFEGFDYFRRIKTAVVLFWTEGGSWSSTARRLSIASWWLLYWKSSFSLRVRPLAGCSCSSRAPCTLHPCAGHAWNWGGREKRERDGEAEKLAVKIKISTLYYWWDKTDKRKESQESSHI